MTRKEALELIRSEINARPLTDFIMLEKSKGGMYVCPICGSGKGSHKTGALKVYMDTNRVICFANDECFTSKGEDTLGALRRIWNCTEEEAMRRTGYDIEDFIKKPMRTMEPRKAQEASQAPQVQLEQEEAPDFTSYFKTMAANITSSGAMEYLSYRHISLETAQRFMLGYDMRFTEGTGGKSWRAIVIPTSQESYVARNTDTNADKGNRYRKVGKAHLFNARALKRDAGRALFITEGEINALSIIECGHDACALGSTSNVEKFTAQLKAGRRPLIVALDNDEAGQRAATKLADVLKRAEINFTIVNVYGDHNDANEALITDKEAFTAALDAAAMTTTAAPDSISSYIKRLMPGEIHSFNEASHIKTGFDVLDSITGGLYPGLYALGAISSLGKTTWAHQLADQVAASGKHVLYFSLEQSKLELASKSLSRWMAQRDYNTALDSVAIRRGVTSKGLAAAISEYTASVGNRLSIIEGDFSYTADKISEYVNRYIDQNGVRPVVVLDYLQILQAGDQRSAQRRDDIDINVTELKRLSRAKNIPVIVISSVNRANYLTPVDFESFKESGGIEFTSDVVLGLQLDCLDEDLFKEDGNKKIIQKRQRVKEAKGADPREIRLVCLKNRYGSIDWHTNYRYYTKYDLFEEVTPDGFVPTHEPTPFDN